MRNSTEKRNTSKDIAPSHCPPPCAATWWFCRQALLGALLLISRIVPQLSFAMVIDPVDSVPQAQNKSVSVLNDPAGHGVVGSRARPKTFKSARKHKIGLPVAFFSRAATPKSPQTLKIEAWPNGSFRNHSNRQEKHKIGLPVAFFSKAATPKSPHTLKIKAWPNGSLRNHSNLQENTKSGSR